MATDAGGVDRLVKDMVGCGDYRGLLVAMICSLFFICSSLVAAILELIQVLNIRRVPPAKKQQLGYKLGFGRV